MTREQNALLHSDEFRAAVLGIIVEHERLAVASAAQQMRRVLLSFDKVPQVRRVSRLYRIDGRKGAK